MHVILEKKENKREILIASVLYFDMILWWYRRLYQLSSHRILRVIHILGIHAEETIYKTLHFTPTRYFHLLWNTHSPLQTDFFGTCVFPFSFSDSNQHKSVIVIWVASKRILFWQMCSKLSCHHHTLYLYRLPTSHTGEWFYSIA